MEPVRTEAAEEGSGTQRTEDDNQRVRGQKRKHDEEASSYKKTQVQKLRLSSLMCQVTVGT